MADGGQSGNIQHSTFNAERPSTSRGHGLRLTEPLGQGHARLARTLAPPALYIASLPADGIGDAGGYGINKNKKPRWRTSGV